MRPLSGSDLAPSHRQVIDSSQMLALSLCSFSPGGQTRPVSHVPLPLVRSLEQRVGLEDRVSWTIPE
ncbi:hypothetical protein RRG08_030942 [Elysia crispata]|uniref:Uncharacterized protein n=1 Tax=Elysia crispata TaxID=231223 RepID=A0AAE1ABX4_9GAST|nr:hypothetical protein RRG08_030942 [Elysia crispata]